MQTMPLKATEWCWNDEQSQSRFKGSWCAQEHKASWHHAQGTFPCPRRAIDSLAHELWVGAAGREGFRADWWRKPWRLVPPRVNDWRCGTNETWPVSSCDETG